MGNLLHYCMRNLIILIGYLHYKLGTEKKRSALLKNEIVLAKPFIENDCITVMGFVESFFHK